MTRSQLVDRLATQNPHLSRRDVERIVATILEEMSIALTHGRRVELRGFGVFTVHHRIARVGRNPKSGEPIQLNAKATPFFKSGKELRQRLNAGGDA